MPGLTASLSALTDTTVANGYALSLALVVLLQYVHSVTTRSRTQQTAARFRRDVEGLSRELLQLSRERGIQKLENQILREVLTQSDCQKAVGLLLRRFIVNPEDSFGLFMPLDPASDMPHQSRGLTEESIKNLALDHATLVKLREHGAVVWETPTINSCPLYGLLAPADRKKARHLFIIGVGDDSSLLGVLIASSLLPIGGTRTEQVDLAMRLLSSIAPSLRQALEIERQSVQLRCTREMLELRSITDGRAGHPTATIEKFLVRLGQMVDVERVALYLAPSEPGGSPRATIRAGLQLQSSILQRWSEHEDRLGQYGYHLNQLTIYDTAQLCRQGIDTLIGAAVVMPLHDGDRRLGVVCLTRRSPHGFSATQRQLLCWAAESLAHSLERAMNLVAMERQARLDGLTGLANRRTFDTELLTAMNDLRDGNIHECSLLLMDLDRFKSVNDQYGHLVGDAVLRETAGKITEQVDRMRSNDRAIAARYGGEEMALLLPGIGINGAIRIAESIRQSIARHTVRTPSATLQVTISIGVSACPLYAQGGEQLIETADDALYRAKAGGRNQVMVATNLLDEILTAPTPVPA